MIYPEAPRMTVTRRHSTYGVRWQAKRDTAMDFAEERSNPKRRRRFALPAHSKKLSGSIRSLPLPVLTSIRR